MPIYPKGKKVHIYDYVVRNVFFLKKKNIGLTYECMNEREVIITVMKDNLICKKSRVKWEEGIQ